MKEQTTADMISTLARHDTAQASLEDLQAAYYEEASKYYEDKTKADLKKLCQAIQSKTTI